MCWHRYWCLGMSFIQSGRVGRETKLVNGLQQVRGENYTCVGLSWYLHCYIVVALEVALITYDL